MKFLYCFVMLYQYVYSKDNYDIEVEGTMRVGDEFLNELTKDITVRALVPPEGNEVSSNDGVPSPRKADINLTPDVTQFMVQIAEDGVKEIKYISRYLQKKFEVKDDLVNTLNHVVNDYEIKLKNYMNYAIREEAKSIIDREYLFLDIIAASNLVLYSEERKMLKMIFDDKKYNVTQTDVLVITEIIHKTRADHMKQEMDYLCDKLNICRPYPGFCEYVSDLIGEVLKLDDAKIYYLFKDIKQKMKDRINFFKAFIKEDILEMIELKIEALTLDLHNVKDLLVAMRSIIKSRYKLMKTSDVELKIRTKAVRILLDVIDKAFNKQNNELTAITFDTTVKALDQWKAESRNEVDMPIKLFFEHIVGVLRENWDLNTREEVMTLTEVMMLGKSDDPGFAELFSQGSASLRNPSVSLQ